MSEFGRPRRHYRVCDSTNERARALAEAGAPAGTVVTAAEQSAGRGRRGRRWSAPAGAALLCSAIVRPLGREHALLPLAVPLAVCDAAEALAPVSCAVKWPNDVWLEERKLAGVLIEARPPGWAVVGVGLNLGLDEAELPDDLRWPAASLGGGVGTDRALAELCRALERWVGAPPARVLSGFRRRDALRGRPIAWEGAGSERSGAGTAQGIDEQGNLLVRTGVGEELALGAGEVSLRLGGDAAR